MRYQIFLAVSLYCFCGTTTECACATEAAEHETQVAVALKLAGSNRGEIEKGLRDIEQDMRRGMEFLVANMPQGDLQELSGDYLLENVRYAYRAWREAPWYRSIPEEIFFNEVLPYANVSERHDRWRREFYERFKPLVKEAQTPSEAAVILNQKVFPKIGVKYSTKRRRADQGPLESIELGLASCTGLSIVLIDACRAVGVPARFVGTPLWSDKSGNHSWVEVWDGRWHFTGAAEPTGNDLDRAWFLGRASQARRDDRLHAIYAVSFRRTPLVFPMVWAGEADRAWAVNVTDRYTSAAKKLPPGFARVMFQAIEGKRDRCRASLKVVDEAGQVVFSGKTNDDSFDRNDHLTVSLKIGGKYRAAFRLHEQRIVRDIEPRREGELITVHLKPPRENIGDDPFAYDDDDPIVALRNYLFLPAQKRTAFTKQPFYRTPLTKEQAAEAKRILWDDHRKSILDTRAAEMKARVLEFKSHKMPFWYRVYGKLGKSGRSLYISMHGGGGAPKQINDRQWENQKRLYTPKEGVYVVPRAPTDTWNLWHQSHIDPLFQRLIENMIVFENVDPDRVYLMGYSAGGDGVYQLAPRMADRLAAASMMAGHPNETSPLGLRNLPFSIHVGGNDRAYRRNEIGREWQKKLAELRQADPQGYEHWAKIYEGKGHWLDREDAQAVEWMAKFTRNRYPDKVVWKQDDVTHARFYWLAVPEGERKARSEIIVRRDGATFEVVQCDVERFGLLLNDEFVDLDKPIRVVAGDSELFTGKVKRTIAMLHETLIDRGDPRMMFAARLWIDR